MPPLPPPSLQIKPDEAKQLVTLVETAGRELLALQKTVAETDGIPPTATPATAGGGGLHYTNGLSGYGFGHGATAAGATAAAAGVTGSFGAFGGGGGGDEAERHRDVFRLCAALEVTSVLLCTLSMALSQVRVPCVCFCCSSASHGRSWEIMGDSPILLYHRRFACYWGACFPFPFECAG